MTALVDTVLLSRITESLDDHGIEHGTLVEGSPHLNANLSDGKHVFVKVTRPGEGAARAATEVTASVWARQHGIAAPEALIAEPLRLIDAGGGERIVTVFTYVNTCLGPALIDRATDAVEQMRLIASVPAPPTATLFDIDYYMARIQRRLAGRRDTVSAALLIEAETSYERAVRAMAGRPVRWSHSDLHLLNLGWSVNGRATVFDWESSSVAPIEVDVSQLLRSVEINTPEAARDYRAQIAQRVTDLSHTLFDIDWDLVNALIRFRSASAASHLIVHGDHPFGSLQANVRLLTNPRRWEPTPDACPATAASARNTVTAA